MASSSDDGNIACHHLPSYASECIEDRDALRIVSIQLRADRDADYAMKDVDEESCQRVYRLIENLNTYFSDLLAYLKGQDGDICVPGMSSDDVRSWEKNVVHVCVTEVIPGFLRIMMDNSCTMLHVLPILLASWSKLCAKVLCVRMMQLHGEHRQLQDDESEPHEEIAGCFGMLCSCFDESKIHDVLYGSEESHRRKHASNASHIVLELEHEEIKGLTDWVDVDCRRLPASDTHCVRARFLRAFLVDCFASRVSDGYKGGMDYLLDALGMDVFECPRATHSLLSVLHASCGLFSDTVKENNVIYHALEGMSRQFDGILKQPGLSGIVDGMMSRVISYVMSIFCMTFDIARIIGGMDDLQRKFTMYEKQILTRLFESKNVSHQLVAVVSMNGILQDINKNEDVQDAQEVMNATILPQRIEWIRSSSIIAEMLSVNLHHAQYIESLLSLLDGLVRYQIVTDSHTRHLWTIIEDDGTFEEIKTNVSQLLGFLAVKMGNTYSDLFCQKLEGTTLSASNIKFVEEMMNSAAMFDTSCHLLNRLMNIGASFVLERDIVDDVDAYALLLNLYRKYQQHIGEDVMSDYIHIMAGIIESCMSKLPNHSLTSVKAPLCLLLKIFQGDLLSSQILLAIYKTVNSDGKFIHDLVCSYDNLLRHHTVSMCSIISEDLMDIIEIYSSILRRVLSGSNYYVNITHLQMILKWTNTEHYPPFVYDSAWNLLEYMVQEERGITLATAESYIAIVLRTIDAKSMPYSAWTCITAYVASILAWESSLPLGDVSISYVHLIRMVQANKNLDVWSTISEFLPSCILDCANDSVARECSILLSHILTARMDLDGESKYISNCVCTYRERLNDCCKRIFDVDITEPASWISIQVAHPPESDLLQNVRRILTFIQDLLDSYDLRDGLIDRPFYSSFKDVDISFRVQFQHLPLNAQQYNDQVYVDISCPRNSLVGDLRAKISEKATSIAGYFLSPENFIIYSKGRILKSNVSRLFEYISDNDEVYAAFTSKPDGKHCTSDFKLTNILSQDLSFCSKLMALQDFLPSKNGGCIFKDDENIEYICFLALSILLRLPMCKGMGEYMADIVSHMGSMQDGNINVGIPRPGFLLYFCIFIYSRYNPMGDLDGSEQGLSGGAPSILLTMMMEGYSKSTPSVRKQLGRAIMQLIESMRKELTGDIYFIDMCRKFVLELIGESLDTDSGYPLSDVSYISSTGLKVVLDLSKQHPFVAGPILKLLITSLKEIIRFDLDSIRRIGAATIDTLCQEHGLDEVIFKEIIVGILLSKAPSNEELQICTAFIGRINGQMSLELRPIVEKLCGLIDECLLTCNSLEGHAKCLQIVLPQISAEESRSMECLVSKIIDQYLFPRKHVSPVDSDQDLEGEYSGYFKCCMYSLDEQDGLYRVLLCVSLIFPKCWEIVYHKLKDAFRRSERDFPSLYNNFTPDRLRPFESYCGLLNGGATCYMNATFQQLFMQPNLRRMLLCSPYEKNPDKVSVMFEALRGVFLQMLGGVGDVVDPSSFWRSFKDYDGNPVDVREHQDAYEFFTRLQDSVDEYLKSLGHAKAIHSVLGGSFIQIIEVPDHQGLRSEREEEFYQISVDVRGKKNLVESLESYVAPETLDGENQWYCEELGRKVDAKKKTMLKKLPESLVFHLKRFEWDFDTLSRWKIKDRFEFPQTIDVESYVDQASPDEIYLYDLSGIIVHSGTAFAGHYYSYARERSTGKWFLFDDDTVEPWDISNIDSDCFGGLYVPTGSEKQYFRSQSAYMLVYDRRLQAEVSRRDTKFLDMLGQIPPEVLKEMMARNMLEMNKLRAFSPGLADFIGKIALEVEASINGPRASKAQRLDLKAKQKTEYHNEVFISGDRRGESYPCELNEAVILCLEYICRIHVYGPCGDASNQRDAAIMILDPLKIACEDPSIAHAVLDACISGKSKLSDAMFAALTSPYKTSRDYLRAIIGICLRNAVTRGESLCNYFVVNILIRIQKELGEHPTVVLKWQDLLGCLSDISSDSVCKSILVDHVMTFMSFAQKIHYVWCQQIKHERDENDFVFLFLKLTLPLLRMHKLPPDHAGVLNDVQETNPFMIRLSSDSAMREIPLIFPEDDTSAATETVQYLLLPGYINLIDTELFMKWFVWESKHRSRVMVTSLLGHLHDSSNLPCLASDISPVVRFLKMEDSYTSFRIIQFVAGDVDPGTSDDEATHIGALDMCVYLEGSVRAYLISIMIISTREAYPETWSIIESTPSLEKKLLCWITSGRKICVQISDRISQGETFRENWMDLIPTDIEPNIKALFDPNTLLERLETFPSSLLVELDSKPASSYPDQPRHVSPSSMTGSLDDNEGLDCIKALDGDDQKCNEEVREIDIFEP